MDTSTEWKYHRLIIIEADTTVEVLDQVGDEIEPEEQSDLAKLAAKAGKAFATGFNMNFMEYTSQLITTLMNAKQRGVDIKTVSHSKAEELRFPPGHPRQGVVYAQHPANDRLFYTAASFHRLAFEHKFAEVITLLSYLGASEITVHHIHGRQDALSLSAGVIVPEQAVNVSASLEKKSSESSNTLFTATFEGVSAPSLPSDMVWYEYEPLWQAIAKARLDKGLQNFNLSLTYEDDYGINGGFKAAVINAGLDLGGHFENHVSTRWQITGSFAPIPANPSSQ